MHKLHMAGDNAGMDDWDWVLLMATKQIEEMDPRW